MHDREARGVIKPTGKLLIVIPCEGGFGYGLGRQFTSKIIFEKRYNKAYEPYIKTEHVNTITEIFYEINKIFSITHRMFYQLNFFPSIHCNLVVGLVLVPR